MSDFQLRFELEHITTMRWIIQRIQECVGSSNVLLPAYSYFGSSIVIQYLQFLCLTMDLPPDSENSRQTPCSTVLLD